MSRALRGLLHRHRRLLRAYRERPCDCRAAEQRDERASIQLIELHSIPASRAALQDIELQAISQRACWNFATSLGSAERPPRYTFGTMNAQIER